MCLTLLYITNSHIESWVLLSRHNIPLLPSILYFARPYSVYPLGTARLYFQLLSPSRRGLFTDFWLGPEKELLFRSRCCSVDIMYAGWHLGHVLMSLFSRDLIIGRRTYCFMRFLDSCCKHMARNRLRDRTMSGSSIVTAPSQPTDHLS
jgi:hypothetical protein